MKDEAFAIPEWKNLATVPSLSGIIGLRILAEIGDVHRFRRAKSLVCYAGLDPAICQSGTSVTGKGMGITKKGDSVLRHCCYLAVKTMLAWNENSITRFYETKKGSGLPSKAAAVAACNKLLRIVWRVLVSKVDFAN